MNSLGIYFGSKIISIVETKGKVIVNSIQIPQALISTSELEEKVPQEVKTVALFKEELRKNKVEAKEVTIALPGKTLFIRTFDVPSIPQAELESVVRFEAKKYIPFKIEDVIFDFQARFDKASRKNIILFVGIKRDVLDKYVSILSQLDLKANAIEYCAFSIIRLLKLSKAPDKGIVGAISLDFKREDEINFTVLENGLPLFSRDITLGEEPEEAPENAGQEAGMILEKIKTEIRISLDYYHRKFPHNKIQKIFFISSQDYRVELETFIKDLGLAVQFIETLKLTGPLDDFFSNIVKGYSASLAKVIKSGLTIDLLAAMKKAKQREADAQAGVATPEIFAGLKIDPKMIAAGLLICVATFIFGIYRIQSLKKDLNNTISQRPQLANVNTDISYEELANLDAEYQRKLGSLDTLVKGQTYLTKVLEVTARVKPPGIWLREFNFKKEENAPELILSGMAYLKDSDKEFALVNKFLSDLKQNTVFAKYFNNVKIISLDHGLFKEVTVTSFTISCRFRGKGKE